MNLIARIHDKEYKIAQGATFSEEYNETLDSGAIRIPRVFGQIDNLHPYDDVYIYESGYDFNEYIALWRRGGNLHDGDKDENGNIYDHSNPNAKRMPFYRHLLVDQFTEEVVTLDAIDTETGKNVGIFSYSIELFSETKGLEMVQVPNCSVTQPLNLNKKTDIYTYLCRFVNRYSPKYKTIDRQSFDKRRWVYTKKYSVAPELKEIFGGVYSQDFTLSNPTLRDVLSTLMITKDMIPYVKDNVIYAKDITKRTGTYNIESQKEQGKINLVVGQMSSADYCDGVRRQYSDALSQGGTCNFIERLGFRNKENSLMTIDNMQIETTHKLYKIKKFYMCYYKKAYVRGSVEADMWFLCKQDISPLIKTQTEWGLLLQDWRDLKKNVPETIDDLSKYKITTVTYDIGSTVISGWGTRYNEYKEAALSVYDITKTYIENIFTLVDSITPFGVFSEEEVKQYYKNTYNKDIDTSTISILPSIPYDGLNSSNIVSGINSLSHVYSPDEEINSVLKFKTFFFEIEYSGFYDGALIHSRDKGNDNFFQNDNQSSSLTLLEKDGFSQKEKLNRFANKTHTMKGRLNGNNYGVSNLLKLGQTGQIGADDDVIIYRREYSIFDNYILVSYAGVQDYVLKNFYTSVYAKYRTYQLMSYGESVNRAETEKVMLILSKDNKYKDDDCSLQIKDTESDVTSSVLFSAFMPNDINKSINNGTIMIDEDRRKDYLVDMQTFTSGNSLCFNIAMQDNASGGNKILDYVAAYQHLSNQPSENKDYYVGSTQQWHNIVDDSETGEIQKMGFDLSHVDRKESILVKIENDKEVRNIYDYSKRLPAPYPSPIQEKVANRIVIKKDFIYKDNKDRIDMTLQIEPISTNKDVFFSEYLMKLSDLISYNKYDSEKEVVGGLVKKYKKDFRFDFLYNKDNYTIAIWDETQGPDKAKERVENLIKELKKLPNKTMKFDAKFFIEGNNGDFFAFYSSGITYEEFENAPEGMYKYHIKLIGAGGTSSSSINEMIFRYGYNELLLGKYFEYKLSEVSFNDPIGGIIKKEFSGSAYEYEQKQSTIAKNMFVEFSSNKINRATPVEILPQTENLNRFSSYKPSQVFSVMKDGEDSYIRVRLRDGENYDGELLTGINYYTQSINYWYFDFDSSYSKDYSNSNYVFDYKPDESGYHFVFGVNITPSDKNRGYVDIYITKTTHRDKRVFDSIGRQVGITHNCVTEDEDGEMVYTSPDGQEYDSAINNVQIHNVSASVEPEGSGEIVGDGMYYKYETAKVEFVPNDGNVFYRWKENDEIIKTNPISFVVDGDRSFIAQCGVNYNIWKDNLGAGAVTTNDYDVELYEINREEIEGDILKISATNLEVITTGAIPLSFLGSFSIDPSVNVSKDTASKAIVLLDLGSINLKVWFENNKIMLNGYRNFLGKKQAITVNAPILDAVLIKKPEHGTITLDFSDENIATISYEYYVKTDVPGVSNLYSGTISRDQAIDNKYIISDVPYGSEANFWATTSDTQNYIPEYSAENPKSSVLGVIIIFKPKSKQITRETLWESTDGVELTYGYSTSGILQLPQSVVLDGLKNYADLGQTASTQYMQFVFDVDGEEKTIVIDNDLEPIAISEEITFESRKLHGETEDENGDISTALWYVLLTIGATQPIIKLKKVLVPSV